MNNSHAQSKLNIAGQWAILLLLAVILVFTLWGIFKDFRSGFGHPNPLRSHRRWFAPQNVSAEPQEIKSWMTFRYVNLVFHLPEDYLKSSLNISDSHYPNLTIDSVAKQQNITSVLELSKTIAAVQKFLIPVSAPQ